MRLQYELSATGANQIRTVLRGVEREAAASNRRMATDAQRTARTAARSGTSPMFAPGRREQMAALRAQEREQIRAERNRLREALASSKSEARARLADERNLARAKESLDRQRSRSLMALHREEQRSRREMSRGIGRGAVRAAGSGIGRVAALGGATMGLVGGIAVGSALAEESAIRRQASQLANQAGDPKLKGALAAESTGIRGLTGSEVLAGQSAFVGKTGDLDTARSIKGSMGELSLATGADFTDLMETAGQAFNVLKDQISDPVERIAELNRLMGALAQQGAMGAIEIKDLAQDFGKLGAATRGFEGGAPSLLRTMGAFAQIAVARGGAESSADASTASARLVNDMTMNRKKFRALGVDLKSKKDPTKLRDPMEIMADVLDKTGGDVMKTSGLFGAESGKIFKGLAATFSEAEKKKKGSGREAVMAEFNRFAGASLDSGAIKAGADSRMDDPDLQFKEAMKQFNAAVGKDLLPALTKLIPEFTNLVPQIGGATRELGKFISFFAENPLSGVMAILGASVAADVAQAGISTALQSGVAGLVGSMTAAQIGMAKFAGAGLVAAAALYAAYDQNESLKKETGGKGILDVAGDLLEGKSLKEIADENLDKQAKEEAARRQMLAPGTVALPGVSATTAPANGTSAASAGGVPGTAPVINSQPLDNSAKSLDSAAKAIEAAAGKLGGNRGVAGASRTDPIISPSRT